MKSQNRLYKCIYCSRTYKLKDNYEKHVKPCEFFHKSQLQSQDDFCLAVETLPTQREMFELMKSLALKCSELEKEVVHLKQIVNVRQKKQILEWLNSNRTSVPSTFTEWYTDIEVTMEDLEKVFQYDLDSSIQNILQRKINQVKCVPICGFSQKTNHLYIFDMTDENVNLWKNVATPDIDKMIFYMSRKIMQKFLVWQKENQEELSASQQSKDREIIYMMKVNGSKITDEKRNTEMKKWLFSKLEENMDMLYEFV